MTWRNYGKSAAVGFFFWLLVALLLTVHHFCFAHDGDIGGTHKVRDEGVKEHYYYHEHKGKNQWGHVIRHDKPTHFHHVRHHITGPTKQDGAPYAYEFHWHEGEENNWHLAESSGCQTIADTAMLHEHSHAHINTPTTFSSTLYKTEGE